MDDDRDTPLTPHRSSGRAKRNGRLDERLLDVIARADAALRGQA